MALQPAAGARDLNPRQVESNRRIRQQLAGLYRLWGYQEVDPPTVERLDTLAAGGGIPSQELVHLVSDDPLGLRPELTASIARAACTRMADRPMPLRLWADGNCFGCSLGDAGRQRIHQQITSGVELLGDPSLSADVELMRLLIAAAGRLGLRAEHRPALLIGHHGVLQALIGDLPTPIREQAQAALTTYDPLALAALDLSATERQRLQDLLQLRGEPSVVLAELRRLLGPMALLDELDRMLSLVAPSAARQGVLLQLDPSFQPHFNLYDGLVLKLVCQGSEVPLAIASGTSLPWQTSFSTRPSYRLKCGWKLGSSCRSTPCLAADGATRLSMRSSSSSSAIGPSRRRSSASTTEGSPRSCSRSCRRWRSVADRSSAARANGS